MKAKRNTTKQWVKPDTFTRPDPELIEEIRSYCRQRAQLMKFRIAQANQLEASIAASMFGYHSGLPEGDRTKLFAKAKAHIAAVAKEGEPSTCKNFIDAVQMGQKAFVKEEDSLKKNLEAIASRLPVSEWVMQSAQHGFGLASMATIIGTTGDLLNFPTPGKLFRFLSIAPYTSGGQTMAGAEWRYGNRGKLTSEQWSEFGYSPSRRSMMFVIGECIKKLNGQKGGPYRAIYDAEKVRFGNLHPEATDQHNDRRAMLIATKLLVENLWREWVFQCSATQEDLWRCYKEATAYTSEEREVVKAA